MSWPRVCLMHDESAEETSRAFSGPAALWPLGRPPLAHPSTALRPEQEMPECFLRALSPPHTANASGELLVKSAGFFAVSSTAFIGRLSCFQ